MLFKIHKIIRLVAHGCIYSNLSSSYSFKRILKVLKFAKKCSNIQKTSTIASLLIMKGNSHRTRDIKIFYNLLEDTYVSCKTILNYERRFMLKRYARKIKIFHKVSTLPISVEFKSIILKLLDRNIAEAFALAILLISGRRKSEIQSIKSHNVKQIGQFNFIIKLDKTKTRPNGAVFNLDTRLIPTEYLSWSPTTLSVSFRHLVDTNRKPFGNINFDYLGKKLGSIKLHSFRNLMAIFLTFAGFSDHEIFDWFGWCSEKMLRYYRKISPDVCRSFESFDELINLYNDKYAHT